METTTLVNVQPATKTETKPRKKTATIPLDELVLAELAKNVITPWTTSGLVLQWITVNEFKTVSEKYTAQLGSKQNESGTRPQLTKRLKELDTIIDENLAYIKNYISEEVGKDNAQAYYAQFGIEKIGKSYHLPKDRSRRIIALQTLLNGMVTRKYGNKTYGTSFWKPIVAEYQDKTKIASLKNTQITGLISEKNKSKEQIRKVLNAVIHLIRANYPDTYTAELRKWGFQKEKY